MRVHERAHGTHACANTGTHTHTLIQPSHLEGARRIHRHTHHNTNFREKKMWKTSAQGPADRQRLRSFLAGLTLSLVLNNFLSIPQNCKVPAKELPKRGEKNSAFQALSLYFTSLCFTGVPSQYLIRMSRVYALTLAAFRYSFSLIHFLSFIRHCFREQIYTGEARYIILMIYYWTNLNVKWLLKVCCVSELEDVGKCTDNNLIII